LIKKVKQKTVTIMGKGEDSEDTEIHTLEIELYDAQAAIRDVLKIHGKFVERQELTGKDGEPLTTKVIIEYADSNNTTTQPTPSPAEDKSGTEEV
jgi:hypothetical protein